MVPETSKSFSTSEDTLTSSQSVISGSLSGLIVRFVIAPIDIVKIRLQLQPNTVRYSGILSTIRTIHTEEGLRAFWKGNTPAAIMYIIYGGSQFWAYSKLSDIWDSYTPKRYRESITLKNTTLGFSAGLVATCCSYPFDLLRTRLASNEQKKFGSLSNEISDIWRLKGIRGFFGGCLVSMLYIGSMTGLSFGAYSTIMKLGESENIGGKVSLSSIAGVAAGVLSKTVVYPLDLTKRHLQILKSGNSDLLLKPRDPNKVSPFDVMKAVIKKNGIKGLYRGYLPSLAKSVPATATSLWCFEFFSTCFRKYNNQQSF